MKESIGCAVYFVGLGLFFVLVAITGWVNLHDCHKICQPNQVAYETVLSCGCSK